jgi:hypothetical protein
MFGLANHERWVALIVHTLFLRCATFLRFSRYCDTFARGGFRDVGSAT